MSSLHTPWRSRARALAPVLLVGAGLVLGQLAARAQESSHISASREVGVAICARCHAKATQAWQRSAHARALDSLEARERQDPKCRQCHTMAPESADANLGGVQCEACHGGGRYYALEHVMRDEELRAALGFEVSNAETCQRCHTGNAPSILPFDHARALERIRHDDK